MKVKPVVALGVLLALTSCTPAYVTQDQAPVMMRIIVINGGKPMQSDVNDDKGTIKADNAEMAIEVRSKNPINKATGLLDMTVFLERYQVVFTRSDGRNVEGVDVPYRISGGLTQAIETQPSGSIAIQIEVVRLQAKLEPPLRNLSAKFINFTNSPANSTVNGGAIALTCFANITLYARTGAGQALQTTGTVQITFADFGG